MNSDVLKAGMTSVSSITYGYDADNNVTAKNTTGVAGAGNNTYVYDQLGRLTSWTKGSTTTEYGWDANSNRVKAGTKLASYDERNRLLNDGTSTYTYSPRGALLSKTTGTTTEAFGFDAFDRMITRSDRDFTYDALDRPVQAGTARMRYDGFSDEVVSDGTQFFGRSASDGLLSVGYETTKRLVLADRHGDIVAGFDPADTTLAAGLPDTRTFDPFGNSTNASGLKYRVGYQGDWTDPRSGDVNQGARWYNPGTGTFTSRDTITYDAGVPSTRSNLYAYAGANPLTFHDPDGRMFHDPGGGGNCKPIGKVIDWNGDFPIRELVCDPPKPPKPPPPPPPPPGGCQETGDCGGCQNGTATRSPRAGTVTRSLRARRSPANPSRHRRRSATPSVSSTRRSSRNERNLSTKPRTSLTHPQATRPAPTATPPCARSHPPNQPPSSAPETT
ncbi:RHS repeat-associated core domain-containing protein [Kribbella sp. CA-247076]|uniref:RHS repeat-associated core domain-containing protein n=1 Tax=Kribbella sp. CA-247076 TaxID=3239941 RepID=UPI003D943027